VSPAFFGVRQHRSTPVLETRQWSGANEVKGDGQALDNRDCGLTPTEATALTTMTRVTNVISSLYLHR